MPKTTKTGARGAMQAQHPSATATSSGFSGSRRELLQRGPRPERTVETSQGVEV